ncbi:unnamed protein product [Caenorhabditis angaria]|uniref:Apyrase n=1 Tax=Caenorhabditis angaria TaxID=860376 RepID=A0A9P1N8R0_9PELO|nr:unnamed protein product [Caenorhabditis angaria]
MCCYRIICLFFIFLSILELNVYATQTPKCEVINVVPDQKSDILLPLSVITDMDARSKHKNSWYSTIKYGALAFSQNRTSSFVHWIGSVNITSNFNFNQKSMEMSDLKIFNNRLLSIDDKMGIVYWLRNGTAIPWVIASAGDGSSSQPFKGEWMTIRNGELYVGSSGHEVVNANGEYLNDNEMFIRIVSANGAMRAEDWTARYVKLRRSIGIHFPGYIIHEAVHWSEIHRKWFFLPRYSSKLAFNPATSYETGSNMLLSTSDCFCDTKVVRIGSQNPHRGFSAFQFVPGTNDEIITALRTEEIPQDPAKPFENKLFATYITVFRINGDILLDDIPVDTGIKYEGLEFANVYQCL